LDERIFWKSMNPHRLHALFNAYFQPGRRQNRENLGTGGKKTHFVDLDVPAGNEKSLVNYFRGG